MGYAVLRVGLRGSECNQPDFYNAGQTEDVEMLLKNPTIQQFKYKFRGFSLEGISPSHWRPPMRALS